MNALLPQQTVKLHWGSRNKERLERLGYQFTGKNTEVLVDIKDLSFGSKALVEVICDYCGKHIMVKYKDYNRYRKLGKDACGECRHLKIIDTNIEKYGGRSPAVSAEVVSKLKATVLEKYGVSSVTQVEEIKEKAKKTCLEKYGVPNAAQSAIVQAKMKRTCQDKYGKDYVLQSEQLRQKIQSTCVDKYGGKTPLASPDVRDKIATTNLAKYGSVSPFGNKEIRNAIMETRKANNSFPTSKPEQEMVRLLKELYGDENCYPQYILDKISFDCLLVIDGIKIDVEYDGKYWHQNTHHDIKRDYFTIGKGYKVLRFRGTTQAPSIKQIQEGVDYLVNSEHHHLIIDI